MLGRRANGVAGKCRLELLLRYPRISRRVLFAKVFPMITPEQESGLLERRSVKMRSYQNVSFNAE
jgi:hypothetical protein